MPLHVHSAKFFARGNSLKHWLQEVLTVTSLSLWSSWHEKRKVIFWPMNSREVPLNSSVNSFHFALVPLVHLQVMCYKQYKTVRGNLQTLVFFLSNGFRSWRVWGNSIPQCSMLGHAQHTTVFSGQQAKKARLHRLPCPTSALVLPHFLWRWFLGK